jgi:hypothetical protein
MRAIFDIAFATIFASAMFVFLAFGLIGISLICLLSYIYFNIRFFFHVDPKHDIKIYEPKKSSFNK